jgi:hypothetical protein
VHQARRGQRPCEPVVRCGLTPDLDARSVEIPLWMFDTAACGVMPMVTAPVVNADALRELRFLLEAAHHAKAGVSQQAEHLELIASGGAHAPDCQAVASGDTTAAIHRTPAAGRTPAGLHAPRARPATTRRGTGSGGTR